MRDREGHDRRYLLDASKIKALGWEPQMPFEEGVRKTVRWYMDNEEWWRKLKNEDYWAYYKRQYGGR